MHTSSLSATGFADSKHHYIILDGLRGVAAIMVVIFHIFETFTGGDHTKQIVNHGYLAVDFFFLLSGFVIGYAYDDRWGKMKLSDFFKRRLIRLHPMIIIGMLVGALTFYFQDTISFPAIAGTPLWKCLWVMLIGFTLLPVGPSLDIRGWTEMNPLNGPAWSLFFEYIGNLLYALLIRKFSNTLLSILVFMAGIASIHLAVSSPNGDLIGGWSLDPVQFRIGLTRLLYPFLAGLLLSRIVKPGQIKGAFLWSSLLLILLLAFPRIGSHEQGWMNGLYDSLSVVLLFPVIVFIGASGTVRGRISSRLCQFLADISFPLYMIHYPFIYLFVAWVEKHQRFINESPQGMLTTIGIGCALLVGTVSLAYCCFKFYDQPIRKYLSRKFISKSFVH